MGEATLMGLLGRLPRLARGRHFRLAFRLYVRFQHHLQVRSRSLQFELQVRHSRSEKVKRNQRENRDAKTARGGDERFRDAAGDRLHSEFFVAEKTE